VKEKFIVNRKEVSDLSGRWLLSHTLRRNKTSKIAKIESRWRFFGPEAVGIHPRSTHARIRVIAAFGKKAGLARTKRVRRRHRAATAGKRTRNAEGYRHGLPSNRADAKPAIAGLRSRPVLPLSFLCAAGRGPAFAPLPAWPRAPAGRTPGQPGERWDLFRIMQTVTRSTLGISALQSRNASPLLACC
jgi:hypothetical protein